MDIKDIQESMSLKEAFQGLVPEAMAVIRGRVISEAPLKIQVINDDKLILEKNIICLPRHLTDYQTWLSFDNPKIKQKISIYDRAEKEKLPGTVVAGEEPHTPRSDDQPAPIITTTTDIIFGKKAFDGATEPLPAFHEITIYNHLRVGEIVYILSFNHGKKYYILDREEEK